MDNIELPIIWNRYNCFNIHVHILGTWKRDTYLGIRDLGIYFGNNSSFYDN